MTHNVERPLSWQWPGAQKRNENHVPGSCLKNVRPCESSALCTTTAIIAYPFIPFIVLGAAIVVLPILGVHELLKAPDAKAASSAGEPEINETVLRKEKERLLSQEKHVHWLASVVMDGQWSTALDDIYISALNQALGWKAPLLRSSAAQFKQLRIGTGFSKIALLESKLGERTLILCARTSVERAGETFRYFETCQSGNIGPSMPYDLPASSEALRAVLVERARKLAALQAKALTEQTTFVQLTYIRPSRNSDAITPDSAMIRVEPEGSGSQAVTTQPPNEAYLNCVTRGVEKCDDLVSCVSGGKRQWTNRSKCD